jgi:putative tricarboxylic transport membrane protein
MGSEKKSSLFLLLFAIATLLGSAKLGLGKAGAPGPGFLPFWGGAVLFLTSLIQFLSNVFSKKKKNDSGSRSGLFAEPGWRKVFYVILALAIYAFFFENGGFLICTFFLMTFLLVVMQTRRWPIVLMESLLITLLSYLLFEKVLMAGFPKGVLGF